MSDDDGKPLCNIMALYRAFNICNELKCEPLRTELTIRSLLHALSWSRAPMGADEGVGQVEAIGSDFMRSSWAHWPMSTTSIDYAGCSRWLVGTDRRTCSADPSTSDPQRGGTHEGQATRCGGICQILVNRAGTSVGTCEG
jgi:hypothetical protein